MMIGFSKASSKDSSNKDMKYSYFKDYGFVFLIKMQIMFRASKHAFITVLKTDFIFIKEEHT
jgi:hypothetical protein